MDKKRKTILIVDDEPSIRQSFADYFEDHQWQTFIAENGEHALKILENESPQAAIIDIRLKGINGHTLIQKIYNFNPNMVFIICTGSPEYEYPENLDAFKSVSAHIFRKPVVNMAEMEQELLRLMQI